LAFALGLQISCVIGDERGQPCMDPISVGELIADSRHHGKEVCLVGYVRRAPGEGSFRPSRELFDGPAGSGKALMLDGNAEVLEPIARWALDSRTSWSVGRLQGLKVVLRGSLGPPPACNELKDSFWPCPQKPLPQGFAVAQVTLVAQLLYGDR